jgi:carbonic anhydrase
VRVAGNVISAEILGTLQYAGMHLQTPLFVVMGHRGCGAVGAALKTKEHGASHPSRIAFLLQTIYPAFADIDFTLPPAELFDAAVEANVRWSMRQLLETPEARQRAKEGVMKLVGAVYDLETGRVRFLS